jgi:hypothetical protein
MSGKLYPSLDFVLGLSTPVKSRKSPKAPQTRERRGRPMTGYAKRMLRSGIALLQKMHGKRNLGFLTVTIPNLPWYELQMVCEAWGELATRLMEEVGRELERHGLDPAYAYTNEMQIVRYLQDGTPAPHLHAIFQGRMTGDIQWAISVGKFRELWERILGNFLGREISLPAATRVEPIRKDAKRYMSKYVSKGCEVVDGMITDGLMDFLPKSWWGMSNDLRRQVKAGIVDVPKDAAYLIADHLTEYKAAGLIKWFCRVWCVEMPWGWEIVSQFGDEPLELNGQFKMLISVLGEFRSEKDMMSFVPTG